MKKAFFVPYTHMNEYVEINKSALLEAGYEAIPLSLKNSLSIFHSNTPIIVNWLEDRPYGSTFNARVKFTTFLKCFFVVIYGAILCSPRIWVRHNFKPHNATGSYRYFKIITSMLRLFRYREVSLEKYTNGDLFHPLYMPDESLKERVSQVETTKFEYLIFGAIKKYKGIHNLLSVWPQEKTLKIAGKCNDEIYEKEILDIIARRELKVNWRNEYLSDVELNEELSKAHFVIISHSDNTMISSGSFYHAISFGCNIISLKSDFSIQKNKEHSFVHLIDGAKCALDLIEDRYVEKEKVMIEALNTYSRRKLSEKWYQILSGEREDYL